MDKRVGRPSHTSKNSKQVPFYLSPGEQYLIDTIQRRREARGEGRSGRSEIVVDALKFLLQYQEGISTELIDEIMDVEGPKQKATVTPFPTPGK